MRTHAPGKTPAAAASIAAQIARLPELSMEDLWALWDECFERRPNHHQRTYLESRLAYRLQERAFGGLRPTVRRRLEQIGETGVVPRLSHREGNRLLPGTMLVREYAGVEHRVLVRGPGELEWQGRRYTSLSAVARAITGSPWSGPVFFGLKKPGRGGGA